MYFYSCLVEWSTKKASWIRMFWVSGSHIGEAINTVYIHARKLGIVNPVIVEVDLCEKDDMPAEVVRDDMCDTYTAEDFYSFPRTYCFTLPTGIVLSGVQDNKGLEDILSGFQITKRDDGLVEIEIVAEASDLQRMYSDLLSLLPSIRVFWIRFHGDLGPGESDEFYANEHLTSQQLIANFVADSRKDFLENGYITLTTYSDHGQTNLSISDHKLIIILTYDTNLVTRIVKKLKSWKVGKRQNLVGIHKDFHHWHYRRHDALDQKDAVEFLIRHGFQPWEPGE